VVVEYLLDGDLIMPLL